MTEAQLSPWLELTVFLAAAYCLFVRWRATAETSTFVLLAGIAGASWLSIWMMIDHAPTLNWAWLDLLAGGALYFHRSKRISPHHPGLQRQHATVIGIFTVMALAHFIYYSSGQLGLEPVQLMYGRVLMLLTYTQLGVVWLAELGSVRETANPHRPSVFWHAGRYLRASVDRGAARSIRGS